LHHRTKKQIKLKATTSAADLLLSLLQQISEATSTVATAATASIPTAAMPATVAAASSKMNGS
jgi:hypothetical protein